MANASRVRLGDRVHYRPASGNWRAARVNGVVDQNNVILSMRQSDGSQVLLNAGVAVPRRTAHSQTNVWRRY